MQNTVIERRFIAAGNRLTAPFRRYIFGEPYKLKLADNAKPTEALDFLKFAASKKTRVPSELQEKAVSLILKEKMDWPDIMKVSQMTVRNVDGKVNSVSSWSPMREHILEALLSGAIDYAPAQLKIAQNLHSIEATSKALACPYLTAPEARNGLIDYWILMTQGNFNVREIDSGGTGAAPLYPLSIKLSQGAKETAPGGIPEIIGRINEIITAALERFYSNRRN